MSVEPAHDLFGFGAGLATSVLWVVTSIAFTAAGRRIGPTAVNTLRLLAAVVLLASAHRLLSGAWWPELLPRQAFYLALSGVVGLAIGDQALFTAFVLVGPRLAQLVMTTAPIFAASLGYLALREVLGVWEAIGIGVTIIGVAWVIAERPRGGRVTLDPVLRRRGLALAFLGAFCQAAGLLLSKQGMGHGYLPVEQHLDPQAATLARIAFAIPAMVPILIWRYRARMRRRGLQAIEAHADGAAPAPPIPASRRVSLGLLFTLIGAIAGPFLGVWMSLVAADRLDTGVAQTVCSLPPVFILPVVIFIEGERPSLRAVLGAVVAVGGVALMALGPRLWPIAMAAMGFSVGAGG